jgi:hypothetical protein
MDEQSTPVLGTPDFAHFGMRATPDAPDFARKTPKPQALARLSQGKPAFSNSTNSLFINETPSAPDCKVLALFFCCFFCAFLVCRS